MFVLLQISTGGTEKVVYEIAKNLDNSKYNIFTAYFEPGVMLEPLRQIGSKCFHIERKGGYDLKAAVQIARIIRRYRIDTVNSHHYAPFFYSFFGSKIAGSCRLVYTEHSAAEIEIFKGAHKILCNIMMRFTDTIVGVSAETSSEMKKMFPAHTGKIHTILNAIDIHRFEKVSVIDNVLKQPSIPDNKFVIGMVANFRKVKNHQCLIKALCIVRESKPNTYLLLVGKGFSRDLDNSENEIKDLISAYDLGKSVIFCGYRDDIANILCQLDLFCLPSFSEGLPISILEAMAAMRPVVGSNVRGIKEVITHEQNGLLFQSNDHRDLARNILRIIESPKFAKKLTENAYKYVCRHHSLEKWVDAYAKIFEANVAV